MCGWVNVNISPMCLREMTAETVVEVLQYNGRGCAVRLSRYPCPVLWCTIWKLCLFQWAIGKRWSFADVQSAKILSPTLTTVGCTGCFCSMVAFFWLTMFSGHHGPAHCTWIMLILNGGSISQQHSAMDPGNTSATMPSCSLCLAGSWRKR